MEEIRLLGEGDLGAALRLASQEGWNQTLADWRRLLRLSPQGCFAACVDGQLAGTVTTIAYGEELAWVGMMLVEPALRGQGMGRRLMGRAVDHLERSGVRTVKLDATPAGRPLYEALGFVPESRIERWRGTGPRSGPKSGAPRCAAPHPGVFDLDGKAFRVDRRSLINALIQDSGGSCTVANERVGQSLRGYALARDGTRAKYVGPLIATDRDTAVELLEAVLLRLAGQEVYVDLRADFPGGRDVLTERGFRKQRDLTRMSRGEGSLAGTSSLVFAIAGPEVG